MKKLLIAMLILSTMLLTSCAEPNIYSFKIAEKADIIHYQKSGDLLYENATNVSIQDSTNTITFIYKEKRYYINNNYNVEVKK